MLKKIKNIISKKYNWLIVVSITLYIFSLFTQKNGSNQFENNNVKKTFERSISLKENGFDSLVANQKFIEQCNTENNRINIANQSSQSFGLFLYNIKKDGTYSLKAWSNNNYHINELDINATDSNYIVQYENGTFEIVRRILKNKQHLLIAIIPIKWQYFIKNKYLTPRFDNLEYFEKYFEISNSKADIPIKSSYGNILFYLKKTQTSSVLKYNNTTIFLRLSCIVFLLLFIYKKCKKLITAIGFYKSLVLYCLIILAFRIFTYNIPFPFDNSKLILFDPSIYASNFFHPSLGDLIINLILIYLVLLFIEKNNQQVITTTSRKFRKIIGALYIIFFTSISALFANILQSLVIDSKISFDVSNFFSLNIFSAIAFLVIGLLFVVYYKISLQIFCSAFVKKMSLLNIIGIIIATSAVFIGFEALQVNYQLNNIITLTSWIIIFSALLHHPNFRNRNTSKISIPFFWVLFFTASATALIIAKSRILEIEQRKKVAEKIYLQSDAITENLLNIATTGFNDNFFQKNFSRFNNAKTTNFIKDSLIAENFSGYLNRFETNIYLFDKDCKPIFNNDSSTVDRWNKSIITLGKSIGLDGLFSLNNSRKGNSYIYKKLILDSADQLLCQLFIILHPKKNKNKGVLPELFHQGKDEDLQYSYPFALYDSGKITEQNGNYDFQQQISFTNQLYEVENIKNASVLKFQPTKSNTVIVVKNNRLWLDFVTLFAYLFFSFLTIIFSLYSIELLTQSISLIEIISRAFKLDIRSQILGTIIFTSIVSFVVIGIITILFFINKFNQASQDKLIKSINYSAAEIENSLSKNDSLNNSKIQFALQKLSEQEAIDYNLFDTTGTLIATTQPYIYNRKLVDNKMNPEAYMQVYAYNQASFKQEEKIGTLPFLSVYKTIINENGKTIACINIPYLNAEAELNQEISGFIATLMNLNAFIFLIAGAIAYLITNRITSSFRLIRDKMKAVNWQTHNDEIIWNKDDEIGALVKEYNIMVKKLDETAKAFALSQREKAWKEMAMQVAHEIKNPLTPMKLSIQYLQKNIDANAPNIKELSKSVANTLIEQIDQLTTIASEFSQFANIGQINPEKLNLNDIIISLLNLYITDTKVNIVHNLKQDEYHINADKIQITRLFTNLIKNAIEASVKNESIKINIQQQIIDNKIITAIQDEGCGISEELQSKIFTLNFTTKSSGTGLGLAICKNIVENANGKIWFETNTQGTIFYVEFTLV